MKKQNPIKEESISGVKIRIGDYQLARFIGVILQFFWNGILRRSIVFNKMDGLDYSREEDWGDRGLADGYYLIWLK